MALDLSALEEKSTTPAATRTVLPAGKPLDIPLADIEEDPNQPRKEFTVEAMQEMTDSIRARGVKTPVSLRTHPNKLGKWMLNYGARRYRGSVAAGCASIPAFVDEAHDDYDQVIENIQRDDLKPMELALFIKKRLDAGDQKKHIAKSLGKDGAIITQHLVLIDPPACIEHAYSSGKCMSPKTLYELYGLYEKFPEQIEAWCAATVEITRKTVSELAYELKGKTKPVPKAGEIQQGSEKTENRIALKFGHDQISGGPGEDPGNIGGEDVGTGGKGGKTKLVGKKTENGGVGKGANNSESDIGSGPGSLSNPLMLVEFDGRSAAVLLNCRPTSAGLIYIRFEEDGVVQEVAAGDCKINLLTEK